MAVAGAIEGLMPPRGWWTPDDLEGLPEGPRYEIVDGALLVSPAPSFARQEAVAVLTRLLFPGLPRELVVLPGIGVTFGRTYRIPDVVVVRRPGERSAEVPPGDVVLAVEVVSPSSRRQDRLLKPVEYAELGIPHFWRVELEDEPEVVVHDLRDGAYVVVATARGEELLVVDHPCHLELRPVDLTGA